jgi:predicted RNA-binding protein with PUA-like domain
MNYFLAKTEPRTYSIDDLAKDKKTTWDGVHNFQAINVIKLMKKGDILLIYHSGGESAVVGIAKIISDAYENKKDPRKSWVVDIEFLKKLDKDKLITLKEVKGSGEFDDWFLVRHSRLSVMPVPVEFVEKYKLY